MAFPLHHREPPRAVPSIIAPSARDQTPLHHDVHFGNSISMDIPGSRPRDDVPPPLPPPKLPLNPELSYHMDNKSKDPRRRDQPPSSFGSGYGSASSSMMSDHARHPHNIRGREDRDEGYASWSSNERSLDSYPSQFGLGHNSLRYLPAPADIHGDSMKMKLNPLRTSVKQSMSPLSATSEGPLSSRWSATEQRYPPELSMPSVKLPFHTRAADSPAHVTETPVHSALSPRSMPFSRFPGDYRSQDSDMDRSPRSRTHRNNSDDASTTTQGSYEYIGADDMELDDTAPLKRLHADDAHAMSGQKRRAASPELRRGETGSRGSPTPRLSANASASTLSRSNSYVSTSSVAPSTATTAMTFDHRSPGTYSSGGVSPTSGNSPYTTPKSLNTSPRGSISSTGRTLAHARTTSSSANARRLPDVQKPSGAKVSGFWMCECCPKKPKKFETEEELRAHASEKQYNCAFCGNRFKNKNEAERHQNSLHVRRHSWSCSALSGYDRAFHESTTRPGEADTCGYCGLDFPRSGTNVVGLKIPNDHDWDERMRHLSDTHKFRECNSSKKFFRADHFRQHLKHSHAGSSGKWTNMLENACMIEEPPPAPLHQQPPPPPPASLGWPVEKSTLGLKTATDRI